STHAAPKGIDPMNGMWLAVMGLTVFMAGWYWYSRYIAERIYRLDPNYVTPAHRYQDGIDFVPTRKWVLWAHHFTSVAGAGPCVGTASASYWAWAPSVLWALLGTVFAAGVHDLRALVISARHRGQSIGTLPNRLVGRRAKLLFLFIILILVLMVNAVFTWIISNLFITNPASVVPVMLQIPIAIWFGYNIILRKRSMLVPSL